MKTDIQKERFKLVTFVSLILRKHGKVLLQKRCYNEYCSLSYACPGGSIDGNESVLQAAIREGKEELGITLQSKDLSIVHVIHFISSHGEFINFFIEANQWNGEPKVMEPEKCSTIEWFAINALPENITVVNRQAIELSSKGIFFSEHGW
ncbi:NUDIX domain-containing protein [Candidatus Dependentiae bacterium]